MQNVKIAVTGGIGSGKSLFCSVIEKEGFKIIYADDLSKKLLREDEQLKAEIKDSFGEEAYIEGELNRKYLAEVVFADEENVKKINSIVHPAVIKKTSELIDEYLPETDIAVEAALIFEADMQHLFDAVVVVKADDETRIGRIMGRDSADREGVLKRMENQMSQEEKIKNADFVIDNNGSREDIIKQLPAFNDFINKLRPV